LDINNLEIKQEVETEDTKENKNEEKDFYSKIQVFYYRIMEFKRILDSCKKQLMGNQNLINYLIVNLPRMKEFMRGNKSKFEFFNSRFCVSQCNWIKPVTLLYKTNS
jgi:hypothetical protein